MGQCSSKETLVEQDLGIVHTINPSPKPTQKAVHRIKGQALHISNMNAQKRPSQHHRSHQESQNISPSPSFPKRNGLEASLGVW